MELEVASRQLKLVSFSSICRFTCCPVVRYRIDATCSCYLWLSDWKRCVIRKKKKKIEKIKVETRKLRRFHTSWRNDSTRARARALNREQGERL